MTMLTNCAVPEGFRIGGVFHFSHYGPDGQLVDKWDAENIVVNQGLDHALGVVLADATQVSTWYVLLKDVEAPDAAMTYQVPVFTEITGYTGDRPAWTGATVSGRSIVNNNTVASFAITASITAAGAGLASSADKGEVTAGEYLFCVADFASAKALVSGDTLEVTYTITAATST